MPNTKRIMISLPAHLLEEVDDLLIIEKMNRSEFIREAMKLYISEKRRRDLREQMKQGYQLMAALNLAIACECLGMEAEVDQYYHDRLVECR